eukprot:1514293-Heterocapsa_arctica.AAC.1
MLCDTILCSTVLYHKEEVHPRKKTDASSERPHYTEHPAYDAGCLVSARNHSPDLMRGTKQTTNNNNNLMRRKAQQAAMRCPIFTTLHGRMCSKYC